MTVSERSVIPARPRGVPERAEWHPGMREWFSGSRDAEGRWQGEVTSYRADGTRASLQNYAEGELDGTALRFHPNGEVARRALYVKGKAEGELRATASKDPTPERLRSCCIPDNAWSLVAQYRAGQVLDQWFEDDQGRRLLSDGTIHPLRSEAVPEAAWFEESSRRWCLGNSVTKGGREGLWRWWSESGEPLDEREFDAGVLSGAARSWSVVPGTFEDSRIAGWSGHFDAGSRSGTWRFFDADGALVCEREFGAPCRELTLEHPLFAAKLERAERVGFDWIRAGSVGLGLCALARHAGESGDPGPLRQALASYTVPLSPRESQRRVVEYKRQKKHSLDTWVQALIDGVEPAVVFSNLGMALLGRPRVGIAFSSAVALLRPDDLRFRLSLALLRFELGEPESALSEVEALEASQAAAARLIVDYRRILFGGFGFPPSNYQAETPASAELPSGVSQPFSSVRRAIAKYALRLAKIRDRIAELVAGEVRWSPPDVSQLVEPGVELETYSFEEVGDGQGEEQPSDVIQVDETLELDGLGLTSLLRRARVEWVGLSWLCWAAGLDRVALPERFVTRDEFAAVLASSLFRVVRISDSVQTRGLRSKTQGLPPARWEGSDVDTLDSVFLGMAKDEAYEMRAVLFFLADEGCRSPWQDDLREA